jgi:O-antigen/teichoic acid export membrane protein
MVSTETNTPILVAQKKFFLLDEAMVFGKEYAWTFVTEFAVMASQILVYKLAAHYFGKEGFSEHAVARRTISLLSPLPLLGLSVALPRYIAFARGKGGVERSGRYLGAAIWCVGSAVAICALAINVFSGFFSYFFFGSSSYKHLAFPVSCVIVALALHGVVYSYFRGHPEMKRANLLQFINIGIVPLVAFGFFGWTLSGVLTALGLLSSGVALTAMFFTPWRYLRIDSYGEAKELLRCGVQRVPGDFIQMALLALPAIVVAHVRGVQEAGSVAFAVSVTVTMGSMFSPIGLVLLPKASTMLAGGSLKDLKSHLRKIIVGTICASGTLTLGILIFGATAIRLYLGPEFQRTVLMVKVIALGTLPYCLYMVLRNVIDAFHVNAVNAFNLLISLIAFGCVSPLAFRIAPHPALILVGLIASVLLLAGLTLREVQKVTA